MRHTFVFVTTELDPATPGGAGAVVARLGASLVAAGHEVAVLLATDAAIIADDFAFEVVPVPVETRDAPAVSFAAANALAGLVARRRPDLVEFQDFDGLGYWALAHRVELGLTNVPIAVRMHGPIDLIAATMESGHPEWDVVRRMEAGAYRMADAVIVPSAAMGRVTVESYDVDDRRLLVGEPPVPAVPTANRDAAARTAFLVYGRLGEVKGSIEAVKAATRLMEDGRDITLTFAGENGWHPATGRSMRAHLESMLRPEHRSRVTFRGRLSRDEVAGLAAISTAVVIPSRFESFCLAAHEARAMGAPLIVPDLPAFTDYFEEATGALVYDGSVSGLAAAMARIQDDPGLAEQLAAAPLPRYRDPLEPYLLPRPRPRHERSQAGLATAAVKAVEAALDEAPGRVARLARRALQVLPAPMARFAVRVVPRRLKDRFRDTASWPEEAERRERHKVSRDFERQATTVTFPDVEPVVSVVIPCFNQGGFVIDAIRSVFAQGFSMWEIIVVDDGSDDPETLSILDRLDYPRTKLIRQENRGLPAARNRGMSESRGKYLVPLDADDELAPGYMEVLVAAMDRAEHAGFGHCWAELFGDQSGVFATRPFNAYQQLLSNGVIGAALTRKDAWTTVGGYDETMRSGNEDWDLWLRLQEAGWGQVQVCEPLFRYRKHGASMSTATEARFEEARIDMATRHPGLYDPAAMADLKQRWYPAVTVIAAGNGSIDLLGTQDLDDMEVISIGTNTARTAEVCDRRGWPLRIIDGGLPEAVGAARGKYLIHWDRVTEAGATMITDLARALESRSGAAAASIAGDDEAQPALWRRWALIGAPDLPAGIVAVVTEGRLRPGPAELTASFSSQEGMAPDDGVVQPPEVEGFLPEWIVKAAG